MRRTSMFDRGERCAGVLVGLSVAMAGCCDEAARCEPAVSPATTPVESAILPAAWAQGDVTGFHVVATTGPYRVSDTALTALAAVMGEQAGLQVAVTEGADTGLPQFGDVLSLPPDRQSAGARRQIRAFLRTGSKSDPDVIESRAWSVG
ncbi:MAG: hypothetical protein ACPMAQ_18015, partial [Phycisphaerae bacterium]